jgi:hypothetical protein
MSKSGIHINPKNKGKFNALKKKTGKSTEELTHSKNPLTRKRAIFAQNAKKWHHEDGGYIYDQGGRYLSGDYDIGGWLGHNVGNLAETIGGTALMFVPGGQVAGIGLLAGAAGGFAKTAGQQELEKQQNDFNKKQSDQSIGQQRLGQANSQQYLPTFAWGGTVSPEYWNDKNYGSANMFANGGSMVDYGLGSYKTKDYWPPMSLGGDMDRLHMLHRLYATGGDINKLRDPNYYGANNGYAEGGELGESQEQEQQEQPTYMDKKTSPRGVKKQFDANPLRKGAKSVLPNVPKQFIETLKDGTKVYTVDGTYVRDKIHDDFTEGGNYAAYPNFIPKGEIWIDKDQSQKDQKAAIIHESTELHSMLKKGIDYSSAHDIANKAETKFRTTNPETEGDQEQQGEQEQPMQPQMAMGGKLGYCAKCRGYVKMPHDHYFANGGHLPQGNSTLKEAKEFQKLYPKEFEVGTQVEYEHTGNTKLAQRIAADHIKDSIKMNNGGEPDYYKKLQAAGISDEMNKMPQMKLGGGLYNYKHDNGPGGYESGYANGGILSPAKAKIMLHDGMIRGKAITDKQRKYFAMIANQKMNGGYVNNNGQMAYGGYYADGGDGPGDNPIGKSVTTVTRPNWVPVTEQQFYNQAIHGVNDTLQYNQFHNLPATLAERSKYIPNSSWKIEQGPKGSTTNPGYLKYFQNNPINMGTDITSNGIVINKDVNHEQLNKEFPAHLMNYTQMQLHANGGGLFGTGSISGSIGSVPSFNDQNPVTIYKGGGTHEQNKYGGIPIGKNKVENGEVRVDFPDTGSYIFSDRISYNK